jgi:hypothetical protein
MSGPIDKLRKRGAVSSRRLVGFGAREGLVAHQGPWLPDDDFVLWRHLHVGVFVDAEDPAAHDLAVGQRDEDLLARSPLPFRPIHDGSMRL